MVSAASTTQSRRHEAASPSHAPNVCILDAVRSEHDRIDPEDLRVDVYEGSTPLVVRVTHLPSGLSAQAAGASQDAAKALAFDRLRSQLDERPNA